MKECRKCKYFHKETKTGTTGACRRYPPQIVPDSGDFWPMTHETDWCGEYEPKNKEERLA